MTAFLVIAAAQFASVMLAIKRLRDRGRNPWLIVLFFVPLVNYWLHFEFLFLPGTKGDNRYGSDPRGQELEEAGDPGLDSDI